VIFFTKKKPMKRQNINMAIRSGDSRAGWHKEQRCFAGMTGRKM
jgi:hypothetical protein